MNIQVFPDNTTVHKIVIGKDINGKNITIYYKAGNIWNKIPYTIFQFSNGTLNLQIPKLPLGSYPYKIIERPYAPFGAEIIILSGIIISVKTNSNAQQVQSDWAQDDNTKSDYIRHKPTATDQQSDWKESDEGVSSFIRNKPTIPEEQVQSDWEQEDHEAVDYILNKPTIVEPVQSDWAEANSLSLAYINHKPTIPAIFDIKFEYGDIKTRTTPYILDIKASYPYTILSGVFATDAGTCTVAVKINGNNVTSLSGLGVTSTITETNATGANTVAIGDLVTLIVSSALSASYFAGKIKIQR